MPRQLSVMAPDKLRFVIPPNILRNKCKMEKVSDYIRYYELYFSGKEKARQE